MPFRSCSGEGKSESRARCATVFEFGEVCSRRAATRWVCWLLKASHKAGPGPGCTQGWERSLSSGRHPQPHGLCKQLCCWQAGQGRDLDLRCSAPGMGWAGRGGSWLLAPLLAPRDELWEPSGTGSTAPQSPAAPNVSGTAGTRNLSKDGVPYGTGGTALGVQHVVWEEQERS